MATRSIKEVHLQPRVDRNGQIGPSPFPLLILALIIAVIFIIKGRAEERMARATNPPQTVQTALPNYLE